MKRPIKIAIYSIGAVFALGLSLWLLLLMSLSRSSAPVVEKRILSAQELSQRFSPQFRMLGGFEASEYGGWHGDGGSVSIYLIDPSDADEFIEGIKRGHEQMKQKWPRDYDYEWSELSAANLSSLDHLIPKKFLPPEGVYLIARERNGNNTISIERKKGYVCFASSRS